MPLKSKGKNQLTAKNLKRLTEKAGLTRKALGYLYCNSDGTRCEKMVYQHWTGYRAIGWKAMQKYIKIFKDFGLNAAPEDFFK